MESDLFKNLRNARELVSNFKPRSTFLTVYIGIFNGEKYLAEIRSFLQYSYWDDFNLVVVDNASTDTSWNEIKQWVNFLSMPYTLVRNPINLGGGGSFELNKDLLETEWVTFIHQDDKYFPNHLEVLSKAAKSTKPKVIAISTEMGSMDESGKELFSIPRPVWLLKDRSSLSYFLANLRTHLVPWGASIFRRKEFLSVDLAWHSTAFPDTEMLLKMCALGQFTNLPVQTMLYRENPISESHGLGNPEKEIAAVAALSRVFSSEQFKILAQQVPALRQKEFLAEVKNGIAIRIQNPSLVKIVELIAEEALLISWNYGEPNLIQSVGLKYKEFGAERVSELLKEILNYDLGTSNYWALAAEIKEDNLANELGKDLAKKRQLLEKFFRHIPYKYRRILLRELLRLKLHFRKDHPHRFGW